MRQQSFWGMSFVAVAVLLGVYLAHAQNQGGVPATFRPTIGQKVDARSAPAKVTSEEYPGLTSKGYVEIGTVTASQPGKKADAEATKRMESAILQKASEAGGDVVRFEREGAVSTAREPTGKVEKVCNDYQSRWEDHGAGNQRGWVERCVKWSKEPVYKTMTVLVSEGTVWRYDPNLATVVMHARAKSNFVEVLGTVDITEIRDLLNDDPGLVAARSENQETPLTWAATNGRKDVAELLLSKGADVNARGRLDCTPLHLAAINGHKDVAELLLSKGADVNWEDLRDASILGHADVVELLNHTKFAAEINLRKPVTVRVGENNFVEAVNPVTNKVYAPVNKGNQVRVIDGGTNAISATVPVGKGPYTVAVNPATNKIYVTNHGDEVTVIDGATNTVSATVPVGKNPAGVAVNPVTDKIYVANSGSNNISVIDGATNTVSATVPVGKGPYTVAVNPATNKIYVPYYEGNEVTVIDGATNKISATVLVGKNPTGVAVNPVTNKIYVANSGSDNISAIDGATNTISATVPVGKHPDGVAVNPATNKIYVANYDSGYLTVIDGPTNTTTTVEAPEHCTSVVLNPATNKIYVPNFENVVVINVGPATTLSSTHRP